MTRVAILGLGKMGEAIAMGLKSSPHLGPHLGLEVFATVRRDDAVRELKERLDLEAITNNSAAAQRADVLILCVKPQQARAVLEEMAPHLGAQHLIISICASLSNAQLREWSGGRAAVVRAMPNTPCVIGAGVTALSPARGTSVAHTELSVKLFESLGHAVVLDESLLDAVTGLSGCGPAYVYLVIEALSDAGVKVGLPRAMATTMAAQTLLGAARMVLERGAHPAELKDEVTTPAGCTIDGLMALEEGKVRVALVKAVVAATQRSRELRRANASEE